MKKRNVMRVAGCLFTFTALVLGMSCLSVQAAPAEWYYHYLPGDYDGNGYDDICTFYPDTGTWSIWYNNNGSFGLAQTINFGYSSCRAVPSDYDGDGKTDLALYDPANGKWMVRRSRDSKTITVQWGWSEVVPVPADYNGDGKTDIAVYYPNDGTWNICFSSGSSKVLRMGYPGAIPVQGDYNGDGRDDVAVYMPSTGAWQAIDALSARSVMNLNWGWSSAMPVPADYSGNGRIDPAVYANGTWYLNFNNGVTRTYQWGGGNVLPVPGYYRSYKSYRHAQIGVFFPDSGTWALKECLIDWIAPWSIQTSFGWAKKLPPPFKN